MKLLFSLLISGTIWARPAAIISYNQHADIAYHIQKIIIEKGYLPPKLITVKKLEIPCQKIEDTIIHLCVNESRKMVAVKIDKEIVLRTLKVFSEN